MKTRTAVVIGTLVGLIYGVLLQEGNTIYVCEKHGYYVPFVSDKIVECYTVEIEQ